MKKLFISSLLASALLFAPTFSFASDEDSGDFFSSLAGPGESIVFYADPFPDGREGVMRQTAIPDEGVTRMEAEGGIVVLESPRLTLRCLYLLYEKDKGQLYARGDVYVDREGVIATGEELFLFPETGEIKITGNPYVKQESETELNIFEGMEVFQIIPHDDYTEIRMTGGDTIICDLQPKEAPEGTEPVAAAEEEAGSGGMNEAIKITARRRPDQEPIVIARSSESSNVGSFSAQGSVTLESESMNLRAHQIDYNGETQVVEALENVFLKQEGIEAESGRMVYDLATNIMTLTINPVVQEISPDRIRRQSGVNSFTVVRAEDGTVSTHGSGRPTIQIIPVEKPAIPPPAGNNRDIEIDLGSDADVERVGKKPEDIEVVDRRRR